MLINKCYLVNNQLKKLEQMRNYEEFTRVLAKEYNLDLKIFDYDHLRNDYCQIGPDWNLFTSIDFKNKCIDSFRRLKFEEIKGNELWNGLELSIKIEKANDVIQFINTHFQLELDEVKYNVSGGIDAESQINFEVNDENGFVFLTGEFNQFESYIIVARKNFN